MLGTAGKLEPAGVLTVCAGTLLVLEPGNGFEGTDGTDTFDDSPWIFDDNSSDGIFGDAGTGAGGNAAGALGDVCIGAVGGALIGTFGSVLIGALGNALGGAVRLGSVGCAAVSAGNGLSAGGCGAGGSGCDGRVGVTGAALGAVAVEAFPFIAIPVDDAFNCGRLGSGLRGTNGTSGT